MEHTLGAELVHDKVHDAHHEVKEGILVRRRRLEGIRSETLAL